MLDEFQKVWDHADAYERRLERRADPGLERLVIALLKHVGGAFTMSPDEDPDTIYRVVREKNEDGGETVRLEEYVRKDG